MKRLMSVALALALMPVAASESPRRDEPLRPGLERLDSFGGEVAAKGWGAGSRKVYHAPQVNWPTDTAKAWVDGSPATAKVVKREAQRLTVKLNGVTKGARVAFDYSGFQHAAGGDWPSRLRIFQGWKQLPTAYDPGSRTVSAPAAGESGEFTLAATGSGGSGDFTATSLSPSATWSSGGNSGDFAWAYPLRTPATPGPQPSITLAYSSSSVDGRSEATNNQPSVLGEGFEYAPGFIERRYVPCIDDMENGASNTEETGDQCWRNDNAILSLDGYGGELIYEPGKGWHARADNGARIEKLTGASNGDNDGEYWRVTTPDGTQYFFGRHTLEGHSTGTDSAFTAPVFGNHVGEPCRGSSFATSSCVQAYRWNLDYVVDVHGNTMSFWYEKESNRYAQNNAIFDSVGYSRGGVLRRIDYGTYRRTAAEHGVDQASTVAVAQVHFDYGDRCLANCWSGSVPVAENWPDTPVDQGCLEAFCLMSSPSFWTMKRLTKVTTKVGAQDIESWEFHHSFPQTGDGTHPGLWLESIVHKGHVGGTIALPPVTFEPIAMANRVLTMNNTTSNWQRISNIVTETGAKIHVDYSEKECSSANLPASPQSNGKRCYPVLVPDFSADPSGKTLKTEYWHKYVVTQVFEMDVPLADGHQAVTKQTSYRYPGNPAWRFADDDGLSKPDRLTWSQYRGYASVETRTGTDLATQTLEVTNYLRGMGADRLVPASIGAEAVHDEDAFAGMVRERVTYNGVGTLPVSKTVNVPWQSTPKASRGSVHARHAATSVVYQATALGTDGSRGWRISRETKHFDDTFGMADWVQDEGDLGVTGDEKCITTAHNRNLAKNLLTPVSRVTKLALPCGQSPSSVDDVISDERTMYDGASDTTTAPRFGLATRADQLKDFNGGTVWQTVKQASYDTSGREKTSTDIRGITTTATYYPAIGGPVTKASTTRPDPNGGIPWTSSVEFNVWGVKAKVTDPNGTVIGEAEFDALGRTRKVWLQGWPKAGHEAQPSVEYTYDLAPNRDRYPVVVTKTRNAKGGVVTSYEMMDGLLRHRQTQEQALDGSGARVVTDTIYDSHGRVAAKYEAHAEPGQPSGSLWWEPEWSLPKVTKTEYDRASRATAEVLYSGDEVTNLTEKWRTVTVHEGDLTKTIPPQGGVVTTTKTDAQGRTTQLVQPGSTVTYVFNRKDQLARLVDAAGNVWLYTYDAKGRMKTTKDPDKGTATLEYNDFNELEKTTDANGEVLFVVYDSLGRKRELHDDSRTGPLRAVWKYDTLYSGQSGFRGQMTEAIRYEPPGGSAYKWQVRQMNSRYQATGAHYVIPEQGLQGTYLYSFEFSDVTGEPVSVTYPRVGDLPAEKVTTTYDAVTGVPNGLDTNWTNASGTMFVPQYDAFGRLAGDTRKLPGGLYVSHTIEYDKATGRIQRSQIKPETSTSTVSDRNYKHDPSGNVQSIEDKGDLQCFGYDAMARLTQAWTPKATVGCTPAPELSNLGGPAPYWMSWGFDAQGNRTSEVTHQSGGDVTRAYSLPAGGSAVPRPHAVTEMTTSGVTVKYAYDQAGNMTCRPNGTAANDCVSGSGSQILTWDAENRLAQVRAGGVPVETNVYDASGRRVIRRDTTGTTLYLPGQELRLEGTVTTGTRYYAAEDTVIASRNGGGVTWLYSDHQGTQQIAVKAGTQAVDIRRQTPYGSARGAAPAWPNAKGFVGGDKDPTGLTHVGARQYDPLLGRFISVDPVMVGGDPAQWDGYQYAASNPITKSDPNGTCVVDEETGKCDREADRKLAEDRAKSKNKPPKCGDPDFTGPCPIVETEEDEAGGCFGGDRQTGVCTPGSPQQPEIVLVAQTTPAEPSSKANWFQKQAIKMIADPIMAILGALCGPNRICGALVGGAGNAVIYLLETLVFKVEQFDPWDLIATFVRGAIAGALGAWVGGKAGQKIRKAIMNGLRTAASWFMKKMENAFIRMGFGALAATIGTATPYIIRAFADEE